MATPRLINNLTISTFVSTSDVRIVLHWNVRGLQDGDFIHIERSTDGVYWYEWDSAPSYWYANHTSWDTDSTVNSTYVDGNGGNRSGVAYYLTLGQQYWYRIRNENQGELTGYADNNDAGVSIYAGVVSSLVPPSNFLVTSSIYLGSAAISGSWTDVSGETSYVLDKQKYDGTNWVEDFPYIIGQNFPDSMFLPQDSTSFIDTAVTTNTRYRYRIASRNTFTTSDYTAWQEIISGLVNELAAPSNLSATSPSASQVDLTWVDNTSGTNQETAFAMERSVYDSSNGVWTWWTLITSTISVNTTSYSNTSGLNVGTLYKYRVYAIQGNRQSGYSNEAQVTVGGSTGITPPSNLQGAYDSETNSVTLTWSDNSSNETNFVVERRDSGGIFTVIATIGANITTYVDSTVQADSVYFYQVKAINATSSSTYAGPISINTGTSLVGDGYGIGAFYGLSVYHHNFFVARNMLIRDNSMENNGEGNFNADLLASPNVTVDNPQSESLMIRRGITIYT